MASALALGVLVLACGQQPLSAVPPAAIRGRVIDARTLASIAGARVELVELSRDGTTAADGRFEFTAVPAGTYTLTVSTIGYIFIQRRVTIAADAGIDLTLPLAEGAGTYRETVTVTAALVRPRDPGVSSQAELGSAALQDLRGVAADDPMRAVQALPGVATGDDFQAEFSVRGSAFRHVGIVIDGAPAALLMHTVRGVDDTGSIAMLNTDALGGASLRAGPHAQRHGDWLGATLEFEAREGSRDRTALRASVSGTSASAVVEGPLGPTRRGSFIVSMRKSYLDWLVRKIEPATDSTLGFFDGQTKVVYDVTSRHQVQVLVAGGDATYREEQTSAANGLHRAASGSTLASAAWRFTGSRWVLTERLSFLGSEFRNQGLLGQELGRGYTQSLAWRVDATVLLGRAWTIEAGGVRQRQRGNEILRDFQSLGGGRLRVRAERDISPPTTLTSGWAELSRRGDLGAVVAGLRVSDRTISDRLAVSPWLLAERRFSQVTVRGGIGASAEFPDPFVVTAGGEPIGPERARSIDIGIEHRVTDAVRWQVTAFRRGEANGLRVAGEPRLDPITGTRLPESVFPIYRSSLDGESRGVDLVLVRRAASGPTGWIAYTWAHTRMTDTDTGEVFDADRDQRHTLNVVLQQRLSYRLAVGAKLRVGSNFPLVGYFDGPPDALRLSAARNRARLPTYARLDVRGSRTFTFDRRRLTLFVELMNVLGRENFAQASGSVRGSLEAIGFAERLIPFVPSAGLTIEF